MRNMPRSGEPMGNDRAYNDVMNSLTTSDRRRMSERSASD